MTKADEIRRADPALKDESDMDELKPCPFCGGDEFDVMDGTLGANFPVVYYVHCEECLASSSDEPTKEQAIKAWNTRA